MKKGARYRLEKHGLRSNLYPRRDVISPRDDSFEIYIPDVTDAADNHQSSLCIGG